MPVSVRARTPRLKPAVLACTLLSVPAYAQDRVDDIDEIVVTSQQRQQRLLEHTGNIARIDATELELLSQQHLHQVLARVPGVWLGRGSGQEHLTAIRSPVLTGAGSCGAFLLLEDNLPIRPAGFCNVNGLIEINSEQARSIEVIRGPGSALYGSNALHGIVNVLQPQPGDAGNLRLQAGSQNYVRLAATLPLRPDDDWLASLLVANDGGFRDATGYAQSKLHVKKQIETRNGEWLLALSATDLDQETAGFILGQDSYRDSSVNRSNPNPEAFRRANAQRLSATYSRETGYTRTVIRPFVRRSDMRFLQHFLPGKPREDNGHTSAGVSGTVEWQFDQHLLIAGVDLEWASISLEEFQRNPTEGSAFLMETRPIGQHYDYRVSSLGVAPFVHYEALLSGIWTLGVGLRAENLYYDYNNRMLDGNTRDDGTVCGFGGCLYSRPADRSDSFTNLAPKLSLRRALTERSMIYVNLARGFRAPQATELYRLQNGQTVADLDSERIDSLELGVRGARNRSRYSVDVFTMRKRGSVFRDADGFNVSDGRSRHTGIEIDTAVDWHDQASIALNASYARHQYDFSRVAARGETFVSGRDIDTAPRWLASADIRFQPTPATRVGLVLTYQGAYFLDAENAFSYPGHTLLDLYSSIRLNDRFDLNLRLNNAADRDYADRADFAFGNYRYFPGRGREVYVELRYAPHESE